MGRICDALTHNRDIMDICKQNGLISRDKDPYLTGDHKGYDNMSKMTANAEIMPIKARRGYMPSALEIKIQVSY